eukprot:6214266-Pleurochrysis_carterae.AAC.3
MPWGHGNSYPCRYINTSDSYIQTRLYEKQTGLILSVLKTAHRSDQAIGQTSHRQRWRHRAIAVQSALRAVPALTPAGPFCTDALVAPDVRRTCGLRGAPTSRGQGDFLMSLLCRSLSPR